MDRSWDARFTDEICGVIAEAVDHARIRQEESPTRKVNS